MANYELYEEIISLIQTKREDEYWDFKSEHHKNKADLLHDILCMANSLHDKDCYIILGIADKTCDIVGVEINIPRRTQADIIDFLRNKKFAGGYCPKIELYTLKICEHEIDVIKIPNTMNTPYYLSEPFSDTNKTVLANVIYIRNGDTNTPINSAAAYSQVEYLWKKRLGLHLLPFEKFCWLIQDKSKWEIEEETHYHKEYPEFTLRKEYDNDHGRAIPEFYSYMMTNSSTYYGEIFVNYFGTTLYTHQFVVLDGNGRYSTAAPASEFISIGRYSHDNLLFKYFIKDTISFLLHLYLFDDEDSEAISARNSFLEVVLVFETEYEKAQFLCHVKANRANLLSSIETNKVKYEYRVRGEKEFAKDDITKKIATGVALNQMLQEFRKAQKE